MDWLNEIANSVILAATGHSALWTAPDDSAFVTMVALNIEIMFMSAIAGIALAKVLPADKTMKIRGGPHRLFFALASRVFAVFVEVPLNQADMLLWEYSFWDFPTCF